MKIVSPGFSVKKVVSQVLLFTLLATLLTGCFKKEKSAKKQETAKQVQLVYYKLFDDEDIMKPLIQEYQSKNPNVKILYRKFTDPVEYENLIINELAEGQGPDIFSVPNYWFLKNTRKINPLASNVFSPKQFDDTFVTVARNDLVLADPADGQTKVFGIPLTVDTLALYYNKAAFDDKIPSRGRPADTWEGLKDDVFQLTKKDNSFERFEVAGIAMGRSDNILRAIDILYMLMLQYKTKFYNDNISQANFSRQVAISASGQSYNPATEALKLYSSFALPTNKNYSWNAYLAEPKSPVKELETFARGKVTMIFGYSYLYTQLVNEIKDLKEKGVNTIDPNNIKVAAVPQVNDPKTSTDKREAFANYYAETVARTSQNPDTAWDFLLFLSSKKNLEYYNQKTHKPTSRRDMIDDQMKDPVYGIFASQIGYASSFSIYNAGQYNQIFGSAIDSILETVSPSDAVRTAEQALNTILPDNGLIAEPPRNLQSTPDDKTTQQTNPKKNN